MTTTSDIRLRVTAKQKRMLQQLAELQGNRTLSAYCRARLFSDAGVHEKLNKIIELLQERRKPK